MKNLKIDPTTGDLFKEKKNMQKVTSLEAIAQNVNSYLQTNKTEIFIDRDLGIPWTQIMVKKNIDLSFKISIIKEAILSRPFINSIISFSAEYVGSNYERKLIITASLKADQGVVPLYTELEA